MTHIAGAQRGIHLLLCTNMSYPTARESDGPVTKNVTYNLVSRAYHAQHGAETRKAFIQDAEKNNDNAAAGLFHEAQQQNKSLADQAEKVLAERLSNR